MPTAKTKRLATITFPANARCPSASVTITHICLFDAATNGNRLCATVRPQDTESWRRAVVATNAIVFGID